MTEEGAITLCHCEKSATKQSVSGWEAIASRYAALAAEGMGLAMTFHLSLRGRNATAAVCSPGIASGLGPSQ